jgi:single-strand DNA-binding protein
MTTICITGNLAADPELKFTPQGKAVASFTVISSKSTKKPDGTWESTDVTPWTIKCWNRLAENVAESLTKGMGVVIQGTATWQSWEDKNSGEKRGRMEVTAYSVGVDLKRHIAKVINLSRGEGGDHVIDDFKPSAWESAKAPSVPESFPF